MSATAPSHTPTVSADPQTTSYVTEAISQLLAAKDCPSKFRPPVDYLVGLAGGRTDWFEAADDEVGLNARPTAEGVSRDAACKWVQRMRKDFLAWEKKANVTFIECMPGGRDPKTKENFKSRYKAWSVRGGDYPHASLAATTRGASTGREFNSAGWLAASAAAVAEQIPRQIAGVDWV